MSRAAKEWEKFGQCDPYYSILNDNRFREEGETDELKKELFDSGERHVNNIFNTISKYLENDFQPSKALDFGCGVGRVAIPLSSRCQQVIGVDVSQSMLNESRRNCDIRSISNVDFLQFHDDLAEINGKYDLIHSYAVFLHIPLKRGLELFTHILESLNEGGVGVIQLTYGSVAPRRRFYNLALQYVPFAYNLQNLIKGRSFFYPQMFTTLYNLNQVFAIMQKNGGVLFDTKFTDHSGTLGVTLYFQKKG